MRVVRCALIQTKGEEDKEAMIDKHEKFIREAAEKGAKIICLQELFYSIYFPAEQDPKWFDLAEPIPDGPTTKRMQELAKELGVVLIVPIFEVEKPGFYYNTAAVIDADGTYLGKYRKTHIPHVKGFWEKYYFRPGNLGYPVFDTAYAKIGIFICYDRHFPEPARILALKGAEILFNPSATTAGLSEYLWKLEQRAHAVANGVFVGAINRVGVEITGDPFYGTSYFCDPYGNIIAEGSRDKEEVVIADLDLDLIWEVRKLWQFFRDRRPETYDEITKL